MSAHAQLVVDMPVMAHRDGATDVFTYTISRPVNKDASQFGSAGDGALRPVKVTRRDGSSVEDPIDLP